jgi:hypothetical protein
MEKRQKFSIWYVLLGDWFVLILRNYITDVFAVKTVIKTSIVGGLE